jgi:hypothetical protein
VKSQRIFPSFVFLRVATQTPPPEQTNRHLGLCADCLARALHQTKRPELELFPSAKTQANKFGSLEHSAQSLRELQVYAQLHAHSLFLVRHFPERVF